MNDIISLLEDAYKTRNWDLVKEAGLLLGGDLITFEEPEEMDQTDAIVQAVLAKLSKTSAAPKPASKKKVKELDGVHEIDEDENEESNVINVVIHNKQKNSGKPSGPVGFKDNFTPTLVSTDISAKEQKNNKKMSTKVIKDTRDPVSSKIENCVKCGKSFDAYQVNPMGKINEESESRCARCQIVR